MKHKPVLFFFAFRFLDTIVFVHQMPDSIVIYRIRATDSKGKEINETIYMSSEVIDYHRRGPVCC